jgi:hypothetical protein
LLFGLVNVVAKNLKTCKIALMEASILFYGFAIHLFNLQNHKKDTADSRNNAETRTEYCAPNNKNEVNKNL